MPRGLDWPGQFAPKPPPMRLSIHALTACLSVLAGPLWSQGDPHPDKLRKVRPLDPAAAMATIEVPDGYRLELVASEPMIREPAAISWDGNGRMYVAEMRTYMQDIDGTGKFDTVSRVSLLDDTDGDGRVDTSSVFIDGLVLPRMVLTLEDSVIIRETNTLDLWEYRDTDGDGVADEKTMVFKGGPRGGNLEHQPSGLDWNIDNWVYVTYESRRYRWKNGRVEAGPLPAGDGQWGLTHDDAGNLYYSRAGGEVPASSFQQNMQYGRLDLPGQLAPAFEAVWPIDDIPDVQGGLARIRADNSLNRFTASCGQGVYRGDRLPAELYGDLFIPEPVGRLIRRASVSVEDGKRILSNATEGSEFLRTTDPNFRPINIYTAPDGTLYIVDMYRGIIQEGNWVREGSYLRGVVQEYGLDRNIGRGRIYRLVHEDHEPGPRPRMLDEDSAELVRHLSHPNGWWRDTAQKLLVLRQDTSVAPALAAMAQRDANPLARLHALWTLHGLDALDRERLVTAMRDDDAVIRAAAIRISEDDLRGDPADAELVAELRRLARDPDPGVVLQLVRTALLMALDGHTELVTEIRGRHPDNEGIASAIKTHEQRIARQKADAERRQRQAELQAAIERGREVFQSLCFSCHASDGSGQLVPGLDGVRLAPSLVGSPRVVGSTDRLGRILLQGMSGPLDGVTYPGAMVSMASNSDQWVADVMTFIRNSWGHSAGLVRPGVVTDLREETQGRENPWTQAELRQFDPALRSRGNWKLTASHNAADLRRALDGDPGSRWTTNTPQRPGMWLRVELPYEARVEALHLQTASRDDYPRGYEVRASDDGEQWGDPIATGHGARDQPLLRIEPVVTRFLEIRQTGSSKGNYWSIHELAIHGERNPIPPR